MSAGADLVPIRPDSRSAGMVDNFRYGGGHKRGHQKCNHSLTGHSIVTMATPTPRIVKISEVSIWMRRGGEERGNLRWSRDDVLQFRKRAARRERKDKMKMREKSL